MNKTCVHGKKTWSKEQRNNKQYVKVKGKNRENSVRSINYKDPNLVINNLVEGNICLPVAEYNVTFKTGSSDSTPKKLTPALSVFSAPTKRPSLSARHAHMRLSVLADKLKLMPTIYLD